MQTKNKIKLINSLSVKKNRLNYGLFVAEGKKTIEDLLDKKGDNKLKLVNEY